MTRRAIAALTRSFRRGVVVTRQTLDLSDPMFPRIPAALGLRVLAGEGVVARMEQELKPWEKEGVRGIKSEDQPKFLIVVYVHDRRESLPRRLYAACSPQGTVALPTNGNQQLAGAKRVSGFLQSLKLSHK